MLFLLGSIVFTSYLTLSFKATSLLRINTFQAIVFNYLTCVITGSCFNGYFPVNANAIQQPWFLWALVMGCVFIVTFNIVGLTTQKFGVSVASVSYKLSLVIPFIFSIFLYNEKLTVLKLLGILIALVAVYLTVKTKDTSTGTQKSAWLFLLPISLFAGSGLLDTMIKYCEQQFLNDNNNNDFLITAFGSAATIGLITLLTLVIFGKLKFEWKAVLAGAAIGIPNYFSIWFLMKVLKLYPGKSSVIIPINNMAIVLFSALAAWILFKEKLSLINWVGITLSVCAIALIAFG